MICRAMKREGKCPYQHTNCYHATDHEPRFCAPASDHLDCGCVPLTLRDHVRMKGETNGTASA